MLFIVSLCVFVLRVFGEVDIGVICDRFNDVGNENDFVTRGKMYAYCLDDNNDIIDEDTSAEWECDGSDITGDAEFDNDKCSKIEVCLFVYIASII